MVSIQIFGMSIHIKVIEAELWKMVETDCVKGRFPQFRDHLPQTGDSVMEYTALQ
jgi:hypothetical protein